MEEKHKIINKFLVPLISFGIFLIPLIMDALQIDFEAKAALPPHWQLVMSAVFSGGVATILTLMKRLYETYKIDYDKEIAELKNEIKVLQIGRDLNEKEIMLTTAHLNDEWLEKNATIEQCEQLLAVLKAKTSRVKSEQAMLETAVNGLTERIKELDPEIVAERDKELEQITRELEQLTGE